MAGGKKAERSLTPEEKLAQALVPAEEQPYPVPGNWCWTTLNHVADWGSGGTPSRKNPSYYEGTIPWIKTGELDDDYIFQTEEHISAEALAHSSAKIFPINTIVIAMYGATIGKVGIMGVNASTNQACACGVCSPAINYQYLFYYACSQKDSFILKAKGGAQPNISQEIIKTHSVPLPPLPEQQRIVDRIESLFAKLNDVKEKAQATVDSFETRKAAILHKAFTGELTAKWRLTQGVDIANWDTVVLSDVCRINPPKANTKDLPDDMKVSFFPMPALSEVYGKITEPQTKLLKEVRAGFTNFSEGDVVFAKITPCMENGKSAVIGKLVNGIGFGTTEFYVLRCGEKLFNRYLHHMLRSQTFRDKAKSVMTGAVGQQRVPKSFLEQYPLHLPSIPEQEQIVQLLDNLISKEQRVKEEAEAVLEQINTMKKAILARAFRGELGTNVPAEEWAGELVWEALKSDVQKQPRTKAVFIPKELEMQLESELERKIIKLYLKNDSETLAIGMLMAVSSKNFEVIDALRNLEQKGIIKKISNGNYSLVR